MTLNLASIYRALTPDLLASSTPNPSGVRSAESIRVCSDSRKIRKNDLFVAIKGDQYDGHQFIDRAINAGAEYILSNPSHRNPSLRKQFPDVTWLDTDSPLDSLRTLAKHHRNEFKNPVIGVIGNVGKTTTKERVRALLTGRYSELVWTDGSENGYLGIPLTLLRINEATQVAVVEIGIDEPGAMKAHMECVAPTHLVLTSLGAEHLEKLGTIEQANAEEWIGVSETLSRGGTVFLPLHNEYVTRLSASLSPAWKASVFYYTTERNPSTQAHEKTQTYIIKSAPSGPENPSSRSLMTPEGIDLQVPAPELDAPHLWDTVAAATALGHRLGLSPIEIVRGLQSYAPPPLRSSWLKSSKDDLEVLLDAYNANPDSMAAGIRTFAQICKNNPAKRFHLVLGDMLELGAQELKFHEDLAPHLEMGHFNGHLFLFGPRMGSLKKTLSVRAALSNVFHFEKIELLIDALSSTLKPGDRVLIKGSRGMKLERVWEAIK